MKSINKYLGWTLSLALFLAACSTKDDSTAKIEKTKKELEKLRNTYAQTAVKIQELEEQLALLDTTQSKYARAKVVALSPVAIDGFDHFVDLQGKIEAENVSYIAPRGMGGVVKAIYVKQGQFVKKGQLLLKLDDAVAQQQVTATKQQLSTITTQLNYAKDLFQRQQNLWSKGIGTEVQLLNARTNVESLENQLKAAQEQLKLVQEQANTAYVYSDVDGIADVVNVKVGEAFVGTSAAGPQIKIVNTNVMKVVVSVPENYAASIKVGAQVLVKVPDINKEITANVTMVSPSIDPTNRGFMVEAKIPSDKDLKANQSVKLRILDYKAPEAMVIPINILQTDNNGKFIYVAVPFEKVYKVHRKEITIGKTIDDKVEVLSGLSSGDLLITQGFQDLYEGQIVRTNQ